MSDISLARGGVSGTGAAYMPETLNSLTLEKSYSGLQLLISNQLLIKLCLAHLAQTDCFWYFAKCF